MLIALGVPQIATEGYASDAVERTYSRARTLCERLGDQEHLFFVLRGLWNCVFDRANLEQSLEIANTLLGRAKEDLELGLAYRAVGATRFNRGEMSEALKAFRKSIEACESLGNDNAVKVYGEAPAIISLVYSGWTLCIQGRLDEGLENGERALKLARQCGYPLVTAFVSQLHCTILAEQRRPAACLALAEEALRFSREHFLVFWVAGLIIKAGWARTMTDSTAGVEQLRTGIESWKKTGAALHIPTWGGHLAEALLLADVTEEAATVLEDALALAYKNGDVFYLSELHRLRGRLHVRFSRVAEAETELLRACEVGRQQEAKLFELRATSDLAQLWVDQGYFDKAASLLTPVLDSFTEGLDTPDLLQARHLLERLSRHC